MLILIIIFIFIIMLEGVILLFLFIMVLGIGFCDNCKMINGIGFNFYFDDCDKFV